mmetsp:Transcript_22498/g.90221  ORF Transcript_22498/g.90221 Transcript_22498/m.90221 type:complete len:205 (-) Transcript_22498:1206-1820(-)
MAAATQNQTRKEVYLRVVDATVEGARAEFEKLGHDASSLAALEKLRERWQGYLVATEEELEREENGEVVVDEEDEAVGEDPEEESGEPVEEVKDSAVEDNGDDEVEKIPQNDGAGGTSSDDDVGGDEDKPESKRRKVEGEDEDEAAGEDSDVADPDDDTVGPEPVRAEPGYRCKWLPPRSSNLIHDHCNFLHEIGSGRLHPSAV